MKLLVDYRESWHPCGDKENLHVGDFQIQSDGGEILFVFERKTIEDLASSIVDGRFREQKQRMLACVKHPKQVVYIIEGMGTKLRSSISLETLMKVSDNLQLREGFTVLYSDDTNHTKDMIDMIFENVKSNVEYYATSSTEDYISCVKVKKSKNIDCPYKYAVLQLCVIPRVSTHVAKAILDMFQCKTIAELAHHAKEDKSNFIQAVSKVKVNSRCIGPKLAMTLCNALGF